MSLHDQPGHIMTQPITSYFDQALACMDDGDYEAAVDYLTRALKLRLGDLAAVMLHRGIALAYLDRVEAAKADFDAAIQQNPHLADAYNERGNLLRLQGDPDEAIADYTIALRLEPDHYAAAYNRALAHEALKQYDEAEADLTMALRLQPNLAPAYEARGRVRTHTGDLSGAIADLREYLRRGGGHEFDNHSEIQSLLVNLRISHFVSRLFGLFRHNSRS